MQKLTVKGKKQLANAGLKKNSTSRVNENGARTVSLGHTEQKLCPVDDFGSTYVFAL